MTLSVSVPILGLAFLVFGCASVRDGEFVEAGFEDETVEAVDASTLRVKSGTTVTQAELNDGRVMFRMNNGQTAYACNCRCGAPSVCESSVLGDTIKCTGDCGGTDENGFPCSGCQWRRVRVPTNVIFRPSDIALP